MSFTTGMSWLAHKSQYARRLGQPVPDWLCVYDLPQRPALLRTALRLGWHLPERVLIPDEFHRGDWSVWGFGPNG